MKLGTDVIGKESDHYTKKKYLPKRISKPRGSLNDTSGTQNTAWKQKIPVHQDGTVDVSYSGFVNTSHGTSCSGCVYYQNGKCMKIYGYPDVDPGNCCNFWIKKDNKNVTEHIVSDVEVVLNKRI